MRSRMDVYLSHKARSSKNNLVYGQHFLLTMNKLPPSWLYKRAAKTV